MSSQKTDPISLDHQVEEVRGYISGQRRREKWEIRLNRIRLGIVLYLFCNIILLKVFFNQYRMDF